MPDPNLRIPQRRQGEPDKPTFGMSALAVAIAREHPHVAVSERQFYEDMIAGGWFIVTPEGIEPTPEYERFNDGSPAT